MLEYILVNTLVFIYVCYTLKRSIVEVANEVPDLIDMLKGAIEGRPFVMLLLISIAYVAAPLLALAFIYGDIRQRL